MAQQRFVVVGGGLAAAKAVEELRDAGFDGRIVLFCAEEHVPYERPPLSKGYLLGNDGIDVVFVHPQEWYDEHDVDVRLGTPVTAIDLANRELETARGTESYDKLLLATGARPRRLDTGDAPVAYLRTIEDSRRLRAAFEPGRRIVLVGGGWIGLEVAAAARESGCEVTVLEALELPLVRVLGPEVAGVFADLHREHGVDLRTGVRVAGFEADGVVLQGGEKVPADLVVVGIGAAPDTALAEAAGLAVDDGVLVDAQLTTSSEHVFAAGDVANHDHPVLGRRIRVEHWDTAIEQGRVAARNMLGEGLAYERLPYFFTDQYDLGMEYVGNAASYDEVVVRGDTSGDAEEGRRLTAWWLDNGRIVAGMHVNDWDAIEQIRQAVGTVELPA
jgi:3-phenylpropionate/trans-cinnamate dioxygenase ferredoxin reductase subunit